MTVNVREPNLAPTANAGTDQEVASGAKVTLDGSGSTDPNTEAPLNTLSYKWTQTAGKAVTLEGATTTKPTFTAPTGPETLEFQLEVCDGGTPPLCNTDKVVVIVNEPEAVVDASVEAIVSGKVSAKKTSNSISAQIRNLGTGSLTV